MAPIEFRAPWSRTLRTASVLSVVVLAIVFAVGFLARSHMPWFGSFILMAAPLAVVAGALPFMVRGYVLTGDAIFVERLGWSTRLPLATLKSVSGDVEALRRSIRIFGNGGLFSFTGEFWNRRLGRFRALATDPDRAVVLRYPKRTIVITPHDPQHFIMRARTLVKHAEFERR
jgi:hypothetical protein